MSWYPHATVATIVEHDGAYLMVEEVSDGAVVINQPAGHLERGETLVEAACRETLEETGYRVTIDAFLGFYRYISPHNGVTYLRFCFIGHADEQVEGYELDDGIIQHLWLTYDEIRAYASQLRSPLVQKCIDDYRTGRRLPLDIFYEG